MVQQNSDQKSRDLSKLVTNTLTGLIFFFQLSSNAVPADLNLKFISKLKHGFTTHGCLHCALLKALPVF